MECLINMPDRFLKNMLDKIIKNISYRITKDMPDGMPDKYVR